MDKENSEKEYIPEQLEDEDFEKEKAKMKEQKEEKKFQKKLQKKEKKLQKKLDKEKNKNKNQDQDNKHKSMLKVLIISLLVLAMIVVIVLLVINISKKTSAGKPEDCTKDFCAFFNARNWDKIEEMVDLKSYYVLGFELEEKDFTKFDETYANLNEEEENYINFKDAVTQLLQVDEDMLNELVGDTKIVITDVGSIVKIQNTENLYKIKISFAINSNGTQDTAEDVVYVAKINGKYKLVFGCLPDVWFTMYNTTQTLIQYYGT